MPRTARLDIPGLLYHVIVRGIERRPIFVDDRDRRFFLERFSALLLETDTQCLAWSLLTNHFHLVLRPQSASLATFMRRLLTSYALTFNLRHKRSGHLFQNRYKSLICDEESYVLELVRYVHLNPLRAGVVKSLEELDSYPWCGHAVVLGRRSLAGQATAEILERFGKTLRSGRVAYRAFLADGLDLQAPDSEEVRGLRRWLAKQVGAEDALAADERVLGGEGFSQEVQPMAESRPSGLTMPLPRLLEKVAKVFDVPPNQLRQRTRLPGVAEARAVFCCLAVREGGSSGAEVARMLRMSRAGVVRAVRRGEVILGQRPELRRVGWLTN
jgi:putative transposase